MATSVPDVWFTFGILIHQDFLIEHDDPFVGFASILRELSADDVNALHSFLSEIQAANLSIREKALLWHKSGAEIFVAGEEIHSFFAKLLETVDDYRQHESQSC